MRRAVIPSAALAAVAAVVAVVPVLTSDRFLMDLLVIIVIFAILATGWNVAGGLTGLFSLGHGALFAAGAYTSALLYRDADLPMLLAAPVAIVAGVLLALLFGAMAARLRGHYFALATLTVGMTVYLLLQNLGGITGGDEGVSLPIAPSSHNLIFADKVPYVYLALGVYVAVVITVIALHHGPLGARMRAVREDEITARAIGIRVLRTRLQALAISGAISAAAGVLYACYTLYVTPTNTAAVDVALQPALMSIIGGMGGVFGPLLGAIAVVGLDQYLIGAVGSELPGLSDLIYGALLIICITVLPGGVVGALHGRRRRRRPVASPEVGTGKPRGGNDVILAAPARRPAAPAGLRLTDVRVRRGGLTIVDGVSTTIPAGVVTSLIGPNGAGKTSLLNVVSGFMRADSGTVHLVSGGCRTAHAAAADRDITDLGPAELCRWGIARTFQQARGFPGLSVQENIATAAQLRTATTAQNATPAVAARALIAELELTDYADKPLSELPTGIARRVEVARALATGPSLLLLDEIVAGLSDDDIPQLMALVAGLPARGVTVLMVEHHLEVVMRYSDHIVVMDGGQVIGAGDPASVAQDPAVRAAYLGGDLTRAEV